VPLDGPPHPFAVAELALQGLRATGANQAILVSGESGAGKTEATKRVLAYLGHALHSNGLEARLLASNPLMEIGQGPQVSTRPVDHRV
jgi:myosin heavy subunit